MHYSKEKVILNTSPSLYVSSPAPLPSSRQQNNFTQRAGLLNNILPIVNGTKIPKTNEKRLFGSDTDFLHDYKDDNNSLISFLKMSYLSRNHTDLEKENAHFRISEAIISTIEHIKWNKQMPIESSTTFGIDCLTVKNGDLASLGNSESNTIPENCSLSNINQNNVKNYHIEEINAEENASYPSNSSTSTDTCAEIVGLALISKFSEKHLPNLSELSWLMSDDAKPVPMKTLRQTNIALNTRGEQEGDTTSNAYTNHHTTVTRGTLYWAPPRRQIIFTVHPEPILKELVSKQKFLCAGCGMRITSQYKQNFRYCTYFGKYHCIGCHHNQVSQTPAYILQNWDFNYYPVCVFAYRLIEEIYTYPLFYVPMLNPSLYTRSHLLSSARYKRQQLSYIKQFIETCRFATLEVSSFNTIPSHITEDIDIWSMSDIFEARSKYIHKTIDAVIARCEKHIYDCELCKARGFNCELCHKNNIIYPWMCNVIRCMTCGSCFHEKCWKSIKQQSHAFCSRCRRFNKARC